MGVFVTFFVVFFVLLLLWQLMMKISSKKGFYVGVNSLYKWWCLCFFFLFVMSGVGSFIPSIVVMGELNFWLNTSCSIVIDWISVTFSFFAMLVSWSIMNFAVVYMADEKSVMSFLWLLLLFYLFMILLVFSGNFLFLFISWESVGLLSFLLISWWSSRGTAVTGSMQAVIYNRIGDVGILLFLMSLVLVGSTFSFVGVFSSHFLFYFFFLGVLAKSSQFLFHPWLPNAMEGPTPVSSLLHSSTMVVAGVYLLLRCSSFVNFGIIVYLMSLCTCVLGGFSASFHFDMKKVIAYSTTSQLGFMMMMLSVSMVKLCLLYMMCHAFFKAMIFMVSGMIIHMVGGSQDFRSIGFGFVGNSLMLFVYFVSAIVMMSVPYLSCFWLKDLVLESFSVSYMNGFVWFFSSLALVLTTVYSWRLFMSVFLNSLIVQSKFFLSLYVWSYFMYLRLFLGSVLVGVFFFFIYDPMAEVFLVYFYKSFPIVIIIVGLLMVLLIFVSFSDIGSLCYNFVSYYNPVIHKMLSFFSFKISELYSFLDYVFMEYLYYYSSLKLRVKYLFFLFMVVFGLIMLKDWV